MSTVDYDTCVLDISKMLSWSNKDTEDASKVGISPSMQRCKS